MIVSRTPKVQNYNITGSQLPTGLSLSGSSISGTPTTAGTYSFTLTATDSLGVAQTFNGSITIDAATVAPPPTGNHTVANESSGKISARGSKKLIWNSATHFGQNTSAGNKNVGIKAG